MDLSRALFYHNFTSSNNDLYYRSSVIQINNLKTLTMKNLYSFLFILFFGLSGTLYSQTYHNVDVANFEFVPGALTINAGDTVVWTNSLGNHNVNGAQVLFPENPESFGNEIGPAGWTYQFIFTIPGNYNYRCDQHSATMFGSVTVVDTTLSLNDIQKNDHFAFFPNPVVNQLSWKWNNGQSPVNADMSLYDVSGKLIDRFSLNGISSRDLSKFNEGVYTFIIIENENPIQSGKIVVNR